jgi:hypothetical protein
MAGPRTIQPTAHRVTVGTIAAACEFRIGAGQWPAGSRAPSVREGAALWGASPLTVLRAYRRLEAQGLLESRDRSGFFVRRDAPSLSPADIGAVRAVYDAARERLGRDCALPALGAFRMLARLAEQEAHEAPEIAFVECTRTQARQHAEEIAARFATPCLALTPPDLVQRDLPPGVRTVVTTPFHEAEVARACEGAPLRLVGVAIECSPAFVRAVAKVGDEVSILHMRPAQGDLVADDLRRLWTRGEPAIETKRVQPARIDAALVERLGDPNDPAPGRACVLSLSNWEAAGEAWRESGAVFPFTYSISPAAWPAVEAATGLVGVGV